jgi:hypothetical protein
MATIGMRDSVPVIQFPGYRLGTGYRLQLVDVVCTACWLRIAVLIRQAGTVGDPVKRSGKWCRIGGNLIGVCSFPVE